MLHESVTKIREMVSLQPEYYQVGDIDTITDAETNATLSASNTSSGFSRLSSSLLAFTVRRISEEMYNVIVTRAHAASWEDSDVTDA